MSAPSLARRRSHGTAAPEELRGGRARNCPDVETIISVIIIESLFLYRHFDLQTLV